MAFRIVKRGQPSASMDIQNEQPFNTGLRNVARLGTDVASGALGQLSNLFNAGKDVFNNPITNPPEFLQPGPEYAHLRTDPEKYNVDLPHAEQISEVLRSGLEKIGGQGYGQPQSEIEEFISNVGTKTGAQLPFAAFSPMGSAYKIGQAVLSGLGGESARQGAEFAGFEKTGQDVAEIAGTFLPSIAQGIKQLGTRSGLFKLAKEADNNLVKSIPDNASVVADELEKVKDKYGDLVGRAVGKVDQKFIPSRLNELQDVLGKKNEVKLQTLAQLYKDWNQRYAEGGDIGKRLIEDLRDATKKIFTSNATAFPQAAQSFKDSKALYNAAYTTEELSNIFTQPLTYGKGLLGAAFYKLFNTSPTLTALVGGSLALGKPAAQASVNIIKNISKNPALANAYANVGKEVARGSASGIIKAGKKFEERYKKAYPSNRYRVVRARVK